MALADGAEVLPPEGKIDKLARALFDKMEHLDPSEEGDAGWDGLNEHEKDFYRTCVETILAHLDLELPDDRVIDGCPEITK